MSKEAMKLALEAMQVAGKQRGSTAQEYTAIKAIKEALANQEEPLPPVEIGVDVTSDGASVVAFYRRPNAVMEMFYLQFHPLAKQEQGVDWKDMYEKEKRRSAMWIAKYEKDIRPLERATPQQEQGGPVAYQCKGIPRKGCNYLASCDMPCNKCGEIHHHHQMVWNHDNPPQQRTWVGLTDEEIEDCYNQGGIGRAIQMLKEKNT